MKKLIQEELELERALNVGRVRGVVSGRQLALIVLEGTQRQGLRQVEKALVVYVECDLVSCLCMQLRQHLPPIAEGCGWHLSYGSETHGYSLNTLYRNLQHVTSPVVLVIKSAALEVGLSVE